MDPLQQGRARDLGIRIGTGESGPLDAITDVLGVRVLKRRGPPLARALKLPLPPVLSGIARQRAEAGLAAKPVLQSATFVNLA